MMRKGIFLLLIMGIVCSFQVSAFEWNKLKFWGEDEALSVVADESVKKDNGRGLGDPEKMVLLKAAYTKQEQRRVVDVSEVVSAANVDPNVLKYSERFSGDKYCVVTDERTVYVGVSGDGLLYELSSPPDKCWTIKTSEEFVGRAWESAQMGGRIPLKEVWDNVDTGFRFKIRAYAKLGWGAFT